MRFEQRTADCGALRIANVGQTVVLNGWAHRVRNFGGVCFIDMRDRTGIVQLVIDPERLPEIAGARQETCLSVTGAVRERGDAVKNPKIQTGDVEVVVESFEILAPAKPLPFQIGDEEHMATVSEELRLKHRYLDLRRPSMYRRLELRAAAVRKIRAFLDSRRFLEVETPIFTRATPEGARDYLVPYRLQPGLFYALPQSPQQYKQLLMVSGVERYYQIAKCFRDEAQRSDRQPEFTQLDLEMSFVTQEDVLQLAEELTIEVVNGLIEDFSLPKVPITGLPRLSYDESMRLYGCDKPDLRFDLTLFDASKTAERCEFGVFKSAIESGGRVRGVRYPNGASLSRKEIQALEAFCAEFGAKGMASIAVARSGETGEGEWVSDPASGLAFKSGIVKFFTPDQLSEIVQTSKAEAGDLLCFIADSYEQGNNVLYRLRNEIGTRAGMRDSNRLAFCFIVDFPLVEWDAEASRWSAVHHPFTSPKAEDLQYLESDPGRVRADCYDIVCNGVEWASGSIRIHQPDLQARVFHLLGISEEVQRDRFGHILEAFQYGAPPHGGIAPGIDRLVMFLTDDENIREVMAFPKIGQGLDPMMGAPSAIDPQQWAELGLRLV